MDSKKSIPWIKNALLAFVLITVGFVIGKEVTLHRMGDQVTSDESIAQKDIVFVYYAHGTKRCKTCLTIERLAKETLEEQFADVIASGKVVFKDVNYQDNKPFAERYAIVANSLIVSHQQEGKETEHTNLEAIWDHYDDPPTFKDYVGQAIRDYLEPAPEATL